MCGIAGLWAPRLSKPERLEHVSGMLDGLLHRGPSGSAVWDGDGVALGITRLAIVAPDAPPEVFTNASGDIHAVVNGEVYNHRALRAQFRMLGREIESRIDTAVVPDLYDVHGTKFPIELDGMFAIALWDGLRRRLVLARDRAGEKPLFIATIPHGLAFASEPGALARLPWVSRDPAPAAIARYLAHGFFAGTDCAFAGIQQLPPAHVLEIGEEIERRVRYWRPWDSLVRAIESASVDDAPRATRDALEDAVRSRVPGDVPFGVFLSGGVDSGLVATLAAHVHGPHFPTFSLRLRHRGYDEADLAAEVARSIGTEHHEVSMDAAVGEEALESFAAHMDQPLGDPSVLPTWTLARLAARHVPVVLTGEGGDELFAGYPTYLGHRHAAIADHVPAPIGDALVALARRFRPKHHHVTLAHMLEHFIGVRGLAPFERHLAWFGTARPERARALLAPELRGAVRDADPRAHLDRVARDLGAVGIGGSPARPDLVAYQLLDFELYLSGDLLTKVDRCTMAHGLESRAPFLRHSLIDLALGLPERARLRGTTGKWALKQAARGLLPESVLSRRKQGFSPPFSAWARGPLRPLVESRLAKDRVARAGVLDPEAVAAVLDDHLHFRADRGRTLWTLLSLQMWAETWTTVGASEARTKGMAPGSTPASSPSSGTAGAVLPTDFPATTGR